MASTPKLMPLARLARGAFSSSVTRVHQVTGTHLHRILGYSHVDRTVSEGEAVKSGEFVVGGRAWELHIYPNGVNAEHRGFVSAELNPAGGEPDTTATYRVSILDHDGNPVHSRSVGPLKLQWFRPHSSDGIRGFSLRYSPEWTGVDLIETEELKRSAPFLLRDDCLDIRCDVAISKTETETETKPRNKWW
jgi:speckle-type POZ protein